MQEHQHSDTGTLRTELDITELQAVVNTVRRTVISRMIPNSHELNGHVEDIAQDVITAAWQQISEGRYDPARAPLKVWVAGIARKKTQGFLRQAHRNGWQSERLMANTEDKTASERLEEAVAAAHRHNDDIGDKIAVIEADRAWLDPRQRFTMITLGHRRAYRARMLLTFFANDFHDAASRMGTTPERLREDVRAYKRHMRVVSAALDLKAQGATGTMGEILDCLPTDGQAGAYTRGIAEAIAIWVVEGHGLIPDVPEEFLVEATGYSAHTIRQRLKDVQALLRVALTVMTYRTDEHI